MVMLDRPKETANVERSVERIPETDRRQDKEYVNVIHNTSKEVMSDSDNKDRLVL